MVFRVGYIRNRYPEIRNIINKCSTNHQYVKIGKLRQVALSLVRAIEIIAGYVVRCRFNMNNDLHAIYKPLSKPKVDVIHTFNTVCETTVPWISTFETMIPRTNCLCCRDWETSTLTPDSLTIHGFELLAEDNCKALLALSESNKNIQLQIMDALNIEYRHAIADKIKVLPPPQSLLITPEELKKKFSGVHKCVEFIFIGGLFYRKGGAQILDAMEDMVAKGMKLHLTIVSALIDDGFTKITEPEKEHYEKMIAEKEWITHFPKLPNAQVLELCKQAHIGLLPSMADTYGYSVLEMQAAGCPVITTDIRALGEINNNKCGYVINVPQYPSTEAIYDIPGSMATLKEVIYQGMHDALTDIHNNPDNIAQRALFAYSRIDSEHSPERYAERLADIYHQANMQY